MNDLLGSAFAHALLWSAIAIAVILVLTYVAAKRLGRHSVIDVVWGLLFCAAAVAAFVASDGHGDSARRGLLLVMALVWGLRLAVHIGRRSRGKGEDPRYDELRKNRGELGTILVVYVLQGVLAYVISAPLLVGAFGDSPLGVLAVLGVVVWLTGLVFEAVGDWQLERFKADPNRGDVMDRGLWRFTRHPNYFGDACVWAGIFLVTAEHWPGVLTVFSPAIMIYLLAFGSGKRVLERHMADRPGYREYMRRTSGFIPLPPRTS